jgi:hypothetical protein
MQTKTIIRGILLLAAAAPLGAHASPLGAKPGAWESTSTTTVSGLPKRPMPNKEQMERMTPEQRAQIQNMMDLQAGKPMTMIRKSCIKDTDTLEKLTANDPANDNCKKKILSQTSTSIEVEVTCTRPHPSTARIKVVAVSSESVNTTTDVQGEGGFKMHVDGKSRWIGASCEGISPQPMPHKP